MEIVRGSKPSPANMMVNLQGISSMKIAKMDNKRLPVLLIRTNVAGTTRRASKEARVASQAALPLATQTQYVSGISWCLKEGDSYLDQCARENRCGVLRSTTVSLIQYLIWAPVLFYRESTRILMCPVLSSTLFDPSAQFRSFRVHFFTHRDDICSS